MSIRPTTRSDIPAIVDILTKAFWDEDAVGRFMHPHREQYPDGVKKFWRRSLRSIWWEGSHSLLVAVNDQGVIVGYANWKLSGGEFKAATKCPSINEVEFEQQESKIAKASHRNCCKSTRELTTRYRRNFHQIAQPQIQ